MKDRFHRLTRQISAVEREASQLRSDLKAAILALPDNPAIQRVGSAPKCFTISSKELFSRDNWTARYHDFKTQYEELGKFIDTIPMDGDVLARLNKVLHDQFIPGRNRQRTKLHPDVIKAVAALLEG